MSQTSIQWTDFSINPIRARNAATKGDGHYCEKISPGCMHCYASRLQPRFGMPVFDVQRRQNIEHYFDEKKLQQVLDRKKPTKWFWCDMSDMFGAWVPDEWITRCFAVMALTPQHTHQLLTKRADRMLAYMTRPGRAADIAVEVFKQFTVLREADVQSRKALKVWPLPNVWLGVSAENQEQADMRIPLLTETPAAVRFVSAEPLLERVTFDSPVLEADCVDNIDWVIVGGESGPKARPCAIEWIEHIIQQAEVCGVPVFVKQMGAHVVSEERTVTKEFLEVVRHPERFLKAPNGEYWGWRAGLTDTKGADVAQWPEYLTIREFPR